MFLVSKAFTFSAAHSLPHLGPGHKCARQHGHNYKVEVFAEREGDLPENGMVVDFARLSVLRDWVEMHWDHRDLNECSPFKLGIATTAENIALHLLLTARSALDLPVSRVRVWETDNCYAEYRAGE